MKDFLNELQKKSHDQRVKILWGTTLTLAVVLIIVWILALKNTIRNTDGPLLIAPNNETPLIEQGEGKFVGVERIEITDNAIKIYFNIKNDTDDILNVSKTEDIELETPTQTLVPTTVLDRQGQPFAQKVLSHTQVFGTLTFNKIDDTQARLVFNQMYLELTSSALLQQKIDLDFDKLNQDSKVRN